MTRKVIIHGRVFDYEEKAPFVVSGMSVLGAIEYNAENDEMKCHECGSWSKTIGHHLRHHGILAADYKVKHGLRRNTPLVNKEHSEKYRRSTGCGNLRPAGSVTGGRGVVRQTSGLRNINNSCKAQMLFRIQMLAVETGHTPTKEELRVAKIWPQTLAKLFGSVRHAVEIVGLEPNANHGPLGGRVKELGSKRMPWPKEYFGVHPLERIDA